MPGVLAIGDSIANGHGDMVNAVQSQSYALWLADAGGWCFTAYSVGGATSRRVVDEQLPRIGEQTFDLVAVSVGTNDMLADLSVDAFAGHLEQILSAAWAAAQYVLVTNVPLTAGRIPGARDRRAAVRQFNDVIARACRRSGAVHVDIAGFSGPRHMRADRVHPNALGQLRIAEVAAVALRHEGITVSPPTRYTLGRPRRPLGPTTLVPYWMGTPAVAGKQAVKRLLPRAGQ